MVMLIYFMYGRAIVHLLLLMIPLKMDVMEIN